MRAYAVAFALTLLVELPVIVVALGPAARRWASPRVPAGAAALTGLLANLATHPAAFIVALPLLRRALSDTMALVAVEVAVLLVEAAVIHWRHNDPVAAAITAGLANLASLGVAMALT